MPWPSTHLQELFDIELPIVQAPMAGAQLSPMAIAVSNAGALGSLPCAMLSPEQVRRELDAIRAASSKPYNVNFFCHRPAADDAEREMRWRQRFARYYTELGLDPSAPLTAAGRSPFDEAMCAIVEEYRPRVVSFHFGLPDEDLLDRVRRTGAKIVSSATTVEEAQWLDARGCDAIIAQGLEAGGHRGLFLTDDLATQLPTFALVPLIVSSVSVPVIATGGIMDGRGVAAALALGAAGVQLGTAFLLCPEATISGAHRDALRGHEATVVTNVISGRPARGILNRVIRELGPMADDTPAFPRAAGPLAPLRAAAEKRGSGDFSPLWAGQAYPLVRELPAAEVITTLATETLVRLADLTAGALPEDAPGFSRARARLAGMTPVGMTARWIAASRAIESERSDALFHDPLARDLAGDEGFAFRRAMGGMMAGSDRDPHLAIRTRFFDDALVEWAAAHEAPQILILAAGMDSRAFRLDWPAHTVLFEVDRAEIFDYKEPIIERREAVPACDRRIVRADLADEWTPALLQAGFDSSRPTAVLIEGLVMYLDEASAVRLFDALRTLVPTGSSLAMDIINREMLTSPYTAALIRLLEKMGCPWKFAIGEPGAFFEQHGWKATLSSPGDPEANYGVWPFPPVPPNFTNMPRSYFVRATKSN
jgi:nitronate monooxygenase